ncbi:hypothetical protein MMC08_008795, partial [Hypocenomyce scalaris]|nr:hypothetical protein [Hypocenomyce scalaris]
EELDVKLPKNGSGSRKYITSWVDSLKLPYLDACFKESFRLHPALGTVLERVVPLSGAKICGEWIPGGTIVGCHTWVLGRHKETFGEDVEAFRPERWLEDDAEKVAMMNRALLQFGAGSRTCIKKNISLLEMYKLVPSFLKSFRVRHAIPIALDVDIGGVADTNLSRGAQITLENPEKEWILVI